MEDAKQTKACPYCGESILDMAIKCKHCGSDLSKGTSNQSGDQQEFLGILALALPVCSALLIFFWIGNMNLMQDPLSKLFLIQAVTIAVTAVLIAAEANMVGAGSQSDKNAKGKKREGPAQWLFGTILLWIVVYPMWMFRRKRYGLRNYCTAAIVSALVFSGVGLTMAVSIEQTKSDARYQLEHMFGY